jgi:hypothetical protein
MCVYVSMCVCTYVYMYMCVYELHIREQQADTVLYNVLLLIQEYDYDLGSSFAREGTLHIRDHLHHVLQLTYKGCSAVAFWVGNSIM